MKAEAKDKAKAKAKAKSIGKGAGSISKHGFDPAKCLHLQREGIEHRAASRSNNVKIPPCIVVMKRESRENDSYRIASAAINDSHRIASANAQRPMKNKPKCFGFAQHMKMYLNYCFLKAVQSFRLPSIDNT